jgi:hypothetical protein
MARGAAITHGRARCHRSNIVQLHMTVLPALAFGFVMGVRHATDPDHIAAVGTIASTGANLRRAMLVGAWWGLGHSASVLLVGGALIGLRTPMPMMLALVLELLVGLMLIGLGARALWRRAHAAPADVSNRRPLAVGVIHGLAGSAVLVLLLVGTTQTAWSAAMYLVFFCVGTVAAMSVVSVLFALPSRLKGPRSLVMHRAVCVVAAVASIGIGASIAHRVGVQGGLFDAISVGGR